MKIRRLKCLLVSLCLFAGLMPATSLQASAADTPSAVIAASSGATYAVKADGSLWVYGGGDAGRLGTGAMDDVLQPVKVMDNIKSVIAEERTALALDRNNTLWATGDNNGKFGNGDSKDSTTFVRVLDGVMMAAVGPSGTLAIKSDGSLWGTGLLPGALPGFSGTVYQWQPILAGETFTHVALCGYYALAIKSDGSLWAWGNNDYGAFGTGSLETAPLPVKVMDDAAFASADSFSSLVVRKDGTLWMSGTGYNAKTWDGTRVISKINGDGIIRSYIQIMDNVLYADSNGNRWFAVKRDNTLWGWGSDQQFGLFADAAGDDMVPAKLLDNVQYVSAGNRHIAVLRNDLTLWTGGQNPNGGIAGRAFAYTKWPLQQDLAGLADAPAPWALAEVREAEYRRLVPPALQSEYTKTVTRKEFCILAVTLIEQTRQMGIDAYLTQRGLARPAQSPFTDIGALDASAQSDILAAYALGVVAGTSPTTFDPAKPITREQAAKMLTAAAKALDQQTEADVPAFADGERISGWARPYIGYVVDAKVMGGVGGNRFDPAGGYQRQQAYMTLLRLYRKVMGLS